MVETTTYRRLSARFGCRTYPTLERHRRPQDVPFLAAHQTWGWVTTSRAKPGVCSGFSGGQLRGSASSASSGGLSARGGSGSRDRPVQPRDTVIAPAGLDDRLVAYAPVSGGDQHNSRSPAAPLTGCRRHHQSRPASCPRNAPSASGSIVGGCGLASTAPRNGVLSYGPVRCRRATGPVFKRRQAAWT